MAHPQHRTEDLGCRMDPPKRFKYDISVCRLSDPRDLALDVKEGR